MSDARPRRVMSIMAHQDDFEFTASGSFALLRERYGDDIALKVVTTNTGATGHHQMSLDDTARRRDGEARAAAALIGADYECLRQLNGCHVPSQVFLDHNTMGGLWNCIRAWEPDVIFCPPVPSDPLAGVHIDHFHTAMAVRLVAYHILVPYAYPTMDGPVKQRVPYPLIINVEDSYSSEGDYHVRQDISTVYDRKKAMGLCHESQIFEWLPFTQGAEHAISRADWEQQFEQRHLSINARYGCDDGVLSEFFMITRWGRAPRDGELAALFPERMR